MTRKPPIDQCGRSRRRFLVGGAAVAGTALLGTAPLGLAKTYSGTFPGAPRPAAIPTPATGTGFEFFDAGEVAFVEAAVARLIPADELGPGALEAGCAVFIDRQLAGAFGRAGNWYMLGPWPEGTEQQGLQSRMTPAQSYRAGIKAVDEHCRQQYDGRTFARLTPERQDELLGKLEKGEVELEGIKAKGFFALLLQNTIEGFFSDPLYGGNRGMVGWKLIGFPGARYDYRAYVERHGERVDLPPVSLMGQHPAVKR